MMANFKRRNSSNIDGFGLLSVVVIIIFIVGGSFKALSFYQEASITQKALNRTCGTNYSVMEVAFAGSNLQALCKIDNQKITLK